VDALFLAAVLSLAVAMTPLVAGVNPLVGAVALVAPGGGRGNRGELHGVVAGAVRLSLTVGWNKDTGAERSCYEYKMRK
jgi:hypothetical protein